MMWYALFPTVLNMSITASAVILVVLLARFLLKRAPKIFSYALWGVVLFRLLCPFSLSSAFSLLKLFHVSAAETGSMVYIPTALEEQTAAFSAVSDSSQATSAFLPSGSISPISNAMLFAGIVWLCGIAVLLIYTLIQFIKLRRTLITSVPFQNNIYWADDIATPFVMGIVHPKIFLPFTLSEAEQTYILRHEQYHIKRGDHITRIAAYAALCIHWFNPLVWLAFFLSAEDMELSCDEAVMKKFEQDIRADYATSLLQFSSGKKAIIGTPLAFGRRAIKERIANIMKYKKPTFACTAAAVLICVTLTACLAANPQAENLTVSPTETSASESDTQSANQLQKDVIDGFFAAFAVSDYETMKTYCTKDCIDLYFHDGDVDGMVWAKPYDIAWDSASAWMEDGYSVSVSVDMETAETSALYPSTRTSFYVVLTQSADGSWRINSFPTG